jgi:membrane protein YdbS with pleckstrin-like domain
MFDSIQPRRRGFAGRPLVALLVAVAAGISEYYVGTWLHLSEAATFAIVIGTFVAVAYIWHRYEQPK